MILVVPITSKKSSIKLLDLTQNGLLFKEFVDGELFIKYDAPTDTIFYIENLPSKIKKSKQGQCNLVSIQLNDQKDQKPKALDKTRLDFTGVECDFSDRKRGTILNAFLHNNNERVTIVKQGSLALTFEISRFKHMEMTVKYYIDSEVCRGIEVGSDLYIEREFKSLERVNYLNQ